MVVSHLGAAGLLTPRVLALVSDAVSFRLQDAAVGSLCDLLLAVHTGGQSHGSPGDDGVGSTRGTGMGTGGLAESRGGAGREGRTESGSGGVGAGVGREALAGSWRDPRRSAAWVRHFEQQPGFVVRFLDDLTDALLSVRVGESVSVHVRVRVRACAIVCVRVHRGRVQAYTISMRHNINNTRLSCWCSSCMGSHDVAMNDPFN